MNSGLKKTIWLVVGGILVSALAVVWLQRQQGADGKQAVADQKARMRAAGIKTDFSEFSVTTDPATRARMATLMFLPESISFGPQQDPLDFLPVTSNGVTITVWKQARLAGADGPLQWSDLHAALDTNDEALDQACVTAISGPIQFDLDLSISGNWTEHLSALNHLSRALGSRVVLQLHDNRPDAAWTNLLAMTRLATAWAPDPRPLSFLLRSLVVRSAFQCTWQALQAGQWPDEQLAALQREWQTVDFFTNLSEAIAGGRSELLNDCELEAGLKPFADLSWSHLFRRGKGDDPYTWEDLRNDLDLIRFRSSEAYAEELQVLTNSWDRTTEITRARPFTTWAELRRLPMMTNRAPFHLAYRPLAPFTESLAQGDVEAILAVGDAEAHRRVAVVAIALKRYRGQHGDYPKSLSALAPEYLDPVPPDFIDGQPLRYRVTDDGHFVLYSIGLDGVDDGGKMSLPGPEIISKDKDGFFLAPSNVDIVWPRPAAE